MQIDPKPDPFETYRATPGQETANADQIKLYQEFRSALNDAYYGNGEFHGCEIGEIFKERNLVIRNETEVVFHQLAIFLWLKAVMPKGHAMHTPPKIDEIWHFFILCTEAYRKFGDRVGGFIDHMPYTMKEKMIEWRKPSWMGRFGDIKKFLGEGLAKDSHGNMWLIEEWWLNRKPRYPEEVWGECG